MINKAEWDSQFFNYPVGIFYLNETSFDIQRFLTEAKKFKIVYIKSERIIRNIPFLKLMDTRIVYTKRLSICENSEDIIEFTPEIHSYDQLLNLAYLSGTYSRFNRDENFAKNEYRRLYRQWLNKSIVKKISFKVLVKQQGDELVGFATLNKMNIQTAEIGLIAVDEKFQGRNIGTQLIQKCEFLSLERNFRNIEVATQYENLSARKLYEKNNFEIKSITYIYHFWNL